MANKLKIELIGHKFTANSGWQGEVVGYRGASDVDVLWEDGSLQTATAAVIKDHSVIPENYPTVFNVGFHGMPFKKKAREGRSFPYRRWIGMIGRCYDAKQKARPRNWAYENCTVAHNWHNYANFKRWLEVQVGYGGDCDNIDKDLLLKGNKVYSEDTCVLLPAEVNIALSSGSTKGKPSGLPIGVTQIDDGFVARCNIGVTREYLGFFETPDGAFRAYKRRKESYLKELANRWESRIDTKAHLALMGYEVETTD